MSLSVFRCPMECGGFIEFKRQYQPKEARVAICDKCEAHIPAGWKLDAMEKGIPEKEYLETLTKKDDQRR